MFGLGLVESAVLVFLALIILPQIFFLITLQKVFTQCAPRNRTMEPWLVWLYLIPFFFFYWNFHLVTHLHGSLKKEFSCRQQCYKTLQSMKNTGIVMSSLLLFSIVPFVGIFAALAYVVAWIIYWRKVSRFSSTHFADHRQEDPVDTARCKCLKSKNMTAPPLDTMLKELSRKKQGNGPVPLEKGYMCLKEREYKDAIRWFTKALQQEINPPAAYFYRAIAHSKIADGPNTMKDLQAAADLGHLKAIAQLQKFQKHL